MDINLVENAGIAGCNPTASDILAELEKHGKEFKGTKGKIADTVGDSRPSFLWNPYIPRSMYTVVAADGGVGKTMLGIGIAVAVTNGNQLPGDNTQREPGRVVYVSSEDDCGSIKTRFKESGGDCTRLVILDSEDSQVIDFDKKFEEFESTISLYKPALVVVDPLQAFVGSKRINSGTDMRPIMQKISNLAKKYQCAIVLIIHNGKKGQGSNANFAALGSVEIINTARSVLRVVFEEDEPQNPYRAVVHTKSNFACCGKSLRFLIDDMRFEWAGFSDITKKTLEDSSRNNTTPSDFLRNEKIRTHANDELISAVKSLVPAPTPKPCRISYKAFREKYGENIFGNMQPKRALDSVAGKLFESGYILYTGIQVREGSEKGNGFSVVKKEPAPAEPEPYGNTDDVSQI